VSNVGLGTKLNILDAPPPPERHEPGQGAFERRDRLSLGGSERVDVNECLNARVACGGVGDDSAAVGVPDCVSALVEEIAQGGDYQVRCFLGKEMAGGQRLAADVRCVLLPGAKRIGTGQALYPPQLQDRAFDLLPGGKGLVVVGKVDAQDDRVVLGESGGNVTPREMVLRVPV
jgi:hypothetical protein